MSLKTRLLQIAKYVINNRKRVIVLSLSAVGIFVLGWLAAHLNWELLFKGQPEPVATVVPEVAYDEFEFPVDSFDTEEVEIRRNQFLSDILTDKGVSLATVDRIAKEYRNVFDVRDMKAGNSLFFYYTPDSLRQLQYMVYKKSPAEYVVYNFRDSLQVELKKKEIRSEVAYMEGVITSSIWNAVVDQGVSIGLVAEISSVFQWMIDPLSVNKGDRFEVIFENQMVDGVSIGVGKVLAAKFLYGRKWFEAYYFEQNGSSSYFNEKGESLKRAFLKFPFNPKTLFRISSRYTSSRMHPILRIRRPHYGVDYAVAQGTPVVSIGDGKVIMKGWTSGGGNTLKIKHNGTYTTGYMHLRGFARGITTGSSVKMGEVIGYVGMTGLATGPHLDFRIWKNGKPVDPLKVESPPVEPVEKNLRPQFDSIVRNYQQEFLRYQSEIKGTSGTL
jgi:murein DD-endopeptidase MepM/ murein hydrolase activator NlpD